MAGAYPELRNKHSLIEETLKAEETQFQATLSHGMKIFDAEIEALNNIAKALNTKGICIVSVPIETGFGGFLKNIVRTLIGETHHGSSPKNGW